MTSPPDSINLPSIFIDKCLWSQSRLKLEPPSHRWVFDNEPLSKVEDAISGALASSASAMTLGEDPHPEKAVSLFAPFHGGTAIIDEVVKVVARKVNADVLMLDALDLAAGQHGLLGEGEIKYFVIACSSYKFID
ncbi:hypothetical protein BT96DRAFT_804317 [Gymnopus androsaceus JB14]|uniref:Uncharacterized protein n=1 Tax=Gymnopus androsaceus JB14 TaxID=1447944 RepID=A0A6A4IQV6_9AGAR|nr:hypothetical protein BT96DRAFT_804317 [Gymnopus androsaceus JB14]